MKYYLVVTGPDNAFVVEATHYNVYEGWVTFIFGETVATSLSPGGNFYFKELTEEEYKDMLDQLDEEDSEEESEPSEERPNFGDIVRQAREDAKPIFRKD